AEHGYRTVTSAEIERLVVDGRSPGPRAVSLTFDYAWASASSVAAPLLKEYGCRAILFAIPTRISDAAHTFVSWDELKAMHASGVFDVQSHTRTHAMIFSDDAIVGFVAPDYASEPLPERPLTEPNSPVGFGGPDELGTPLFERRSRMSDARRFVPDPEAAARCRSHVREHGSAAFFNRPAWRRELEAISGGGRG